MISQLKKIEMNEYLHLNYRKVLNNAPAKPK
jgi:hypothetical protein